MGRQEKPIDWNYIEMAMLAGVNQTRILESIDLNKCNFIRRFKERYGENFESYATKKHQQGNSLLEVAQFQKALNNSHKGNSQMLMYLGKVKLGQKEPEEKANEDAKAQFGAIMEQLSSIQQEKINFNNQESTESSLESSLSMDDNMNSNET